MMTRQRKRPALAKLTTFVAYRALAFVQAPLGFVFWAIEKRKAQIQDWFDSIEDGNHE